MDEGTLNDLLECSVCLERLDTSSKVLPCQHTFCKKCLEEIVQKHKELRCPECRVLVTIKVEELPPNVLLMRILEGMRNAGSAIPKRVHRTTRSPNMTLQQMSHATPVHQQHGAPDHRIISSNKQQALHLIPHQPYAKAMYDYSGDLSFKRGDVIILQKRIDSHWYQGECGGKQGVFPLSYVQIITPVPSHIPQCKALYDFRMTNDEEEGCLAFCKGDIINVIRRVDENWAEGKLDGRIGIFPLAFVELNNLARSLMKLSSNAQPGPSRVAPPTPTAEDSSPLIPTDHTRALVPHRAAQQGAPPAPAASSGSSSTTPNASSSNNSSSSSSTGPSSPASPPLAGGRQLPPKNAQARPDPLAPAHTSPRPSQPPCAEKRRSLVLHRRSAEIEAGGERGRRNGVGTPEAPPATYVALYAYKPQRADELELKKGGIYMVTERCQDGWFKGTSNRTQKGGVFPGNYVAQARGPPHGAIDARAASAPARADARGCPASRPPELPPRAASPPADGGNSSRSGAHETGGGGAARSGDKSKERKEKGTVSLMKRLTSMKRSKSPPASSYSMDNPVFEDSSLAPVKSSSALNHVHVRSGSCPSQLLQLQPSDHHRMFGSTSQRHKHKERPSILTHSSRPADTTRAGSSGSSPDVVHRHRKSNSLDAGSGGSEPKAASARTVRERFRCVTPYPPNSEYELELRVDDIVYVHKKRDDGWYKGTQQRTGKTGLFPASFVDSF